MIKCKRNRDRVFQNRSRINLPATTKKRGAFVSIEDNTFSEPHGFTTEDILWTLGIWSVILGLSPVIMFYMLMVA